MELREARIIYDLLLESKHQTLVKQLIKNAVHYSSMRVEWYLSGNKERNEIGDFACLINAIIGLNAR